VLDCQHALDARDKTQKICDRRIPVGGASRTRARSDSSHAAAVVVGTVIGSGIFLVPTEMMQAVGSASLVFAAWIAGGLLSMCGYAVA
jgi:amino acid permease